ncbi:unnamed protein product [Schistosoma curassoni]|uniref:Uncharacterized protein n=1 Tax=Schistosoma curassoni TaxID=6186 RepID=A0A183KY06_9TREM|nr:unnamed protein product [Schistosoma curassoni]
MSGSLTGLQTNGAHGLQYHETKNGIGVGGSRQETLDPGFVLHGTRQRGVPVILSELVLPDEFDPSSLQVHLADKCQVARNPGPGFPVDYLQPPSNLHSTCNVESPRLVDTLQLDR